MPFFPIQSVCIATRPTAWWQGRGAIPGEPAASASGAPFGRHRPRCRGPAIVKRISQKREGAHSRDPLTAIRWLHPGWSLIGSD